jgi:hypothetical protein
VLMARASMPRKYALRMMAPRLPGLSTSSMKRMTGRRHVRVNGRDEGEPLTARSSRDCGEGWRVMLDSD